ncbi:MAG: TIGR02266 family protein [Kofleriaceae bacterium]
MDDASQSDKRGDGRAPIELKVEYKRQNAFFADYTRNISRGGTFIRTTRPLPIGTEFVFKLFVPKLDAPLELVGEVSWVVSELEATDGGREPGMGIKFTYRTGATRAQVEALVERLMVDSLGQRLYAKLMDQRQG